MLIPVVHAVRIWHTKEGYYAGPVKDVLVLQREVIVCNPRGHAEVLGVVECVQHQVFVPGMLHDDLSWVIVGNLRVVRFD